MGPVTNVVLFDKEAGGVASVRYDNAEAAAACVSVRCPLLEADIAPFQCKLGWFLIIIPLGNAWSTLLRNDR